MFSPGCPSLIFSLVRAALWRKTQKAFRLDKCARVRKNQRPFTWTYNNTYVHTEYVLIHHHLIPVSYCISSPCWPLSSRRKAKCCDTINCNALHCTAFLSIASLFIVCYVNLLCVFVHFCGIPFRPIASQK